MKCDELKDKWFNAYPEIMGIEGGKPTKCYGKAEVDEAFAELKEVYKDSVDVKVKIWERYKKAEDELRKTQRALWMARKAHAVAMFAYWDAHYRDNPNAVYRNRTIDWLRNRWLLILDAIIKKEKEYK